MSTIDYSRFAKIFQLFFFLHIFSNITNVTTTYISFNIIIPTCMYVYCITYIFSYNIYCIT